LIVVYGIILVVTIYQESEAYMVVSPASNLKAVREEIHIPQEALARDAGISLATLRSVEKGNRCKYVTATRILAAVNKHRKSRKLPDLSMDDLGLNIE
jgi:DNA-binding XRE family transcriptional regulator